jgi:hypothetical protein
MKRCPNIRDLMIGSYDCEQETDVEQLERYRYGAECTFTAVIGGIGAIGNLIFHCSAYTKETIDDQLTAIGWLIQELAEIASHTQEIESAASYQQRKLEIAKARGGRS